MGLYILHFRAAEVEILVTDLERANARVVAAERELETVQRTHELSASSSSSSSQKVQKQQIYLLFSVALQLIKVALQCYNDIHTLKKYHFLFSCRVPLCLVQSPNHVLSLGHI